MSTVWRARLKELLEAKDTLHNTTAALREAPTDEPVGGGGDRGEKPRTRETVTAKTAETPPSDPTFSKNVQTSPAKTAKTAKTPVEGEDPRKLGAAAKLGLVAMWSRRYGYVSIHDPTTGEWHDLRTEDAPRWAVGEARRRKELCRDGNLRAYQLNSRETEKIWRDKHAPADVGIVEEFPVEERERRRDVRLLR